MTMQELLEDSVRTLGSIRPSVEEYETVTAPVMRVRNNLIQLLIKLQQEAEKQDEEV